MGAGSSWTFDLEGYSKYSGRLCTLAAWLEAPVVTSSPGPDQGALPACASEVFELWVVEKEAKTAVFGYFVTWNHQLNHLTRVTRVLATLRGVVQVRQVILFLCRVAGWPSYAVSSGVPVMALSVLAACDPSPVPGIRVVSPMALVMFQKPLMSQIPIGWLIFVRGVC